MKLYIVLEPDRTANGQPVCAFDEYNDSELHHQLISSCSVQVSSTRTDLTNVKALENNANQTSVITQLEI